MRLCRGRTTRPDPTSGIRPFGGTENIYQYNSGGVFEQNQIIANVRVSVGNRLSLFGFYALEFSNSDLGWGGPISIGSAGAGFGGFFGGTAQLRRSSSSNSYDPMQD